MTHSSAHRRLLSIVSILWLCIVGAGVLEASERTAPQSSDTCVACHSRDQVVGLYQTSTHREAGIGCDGCHGGDSAQTDKANAHAGGFIARPDTSGTLEMCGKCHSKPLEFFKGSKHLASRANAARLDCVECHGVHAIGAASESFRWPQFCAGCHGLEYLPQLPKPFQEMLGLVDELNDALRRLQSKGRLNQELMQGRKGIRHSISELVHKTDSKEGATERISQILESGRSLKERITAEQNR